MSNIEIALKKLQYDIFEPSLKTHKLKGNLKAFWAASIDYEYRIVFELEAKSDYFDIILHTIGTHDEVY